MAGVEGKAGAPASDWATHSSSRSFPPMSEPAAPPPPQATGIRRLAVLLVATVLVAAALVVTRDRFAPQAPAPATDPLEGVEDPVARALRTAAVDTTRRTQWLDEVEGVDVSALGSAQRELFLRVANSQRCACDCGYTLAECRAFDPACSLSTPRLESMRDSVVAGTFRAPAGLRERPVVGR